MRVYAGNVAALRQAVPRNQARGQEAPGVGGHRELSPHVDLRHEDSVQVGCFSSAILVGHTISLIDPAHVFRCSLGS